MPERDRKSADNLIEFFAQAYKEKDVADYDEALDEAFFFQFTKDVADSLGLPEDKPWWGKTEDVASTDQMFKSPSVTDISFTYEFFTNWQAIEEVREDTTFSGLFCRLDPTIEVTTIIEAEDPIRKFRVDGSWLNVIVVPDRYTEGLWTILKIEEELKNPGS